MKLLCPVEDDRAFAASENAGPPMAAPLPANETERLAVLDEYGLLDTEPEQTYDDVVQLAAYLCGAPVAAISLIDARRQWFKAILGFDAAETSRDTAFCAHTILQQGVMVVPDTTKDPRFQENPLVTGEPGIRFYAGAPLVTDDGYALGSLCVLDSIPRNLTAEQERALRTLAHLVLGQMELRRQAAAQGQLLAERERAVVEVRQSEARLAEAQRIAHIGSWEIEVATKRLTWSREMFRLLDFDPAQGEPPYEEAWARYEPDDAAECDRLFAQTLDTGDPFQCEMRLLLPSGAFRWCHVIAQPERDADGRVVRVAGTVLDITERVERERRVRDTNLVLEVQKAQLHAANAELGALATTDPLTGLLNHPAFQARLTEETIRAQHRGRPLAVAILDIDGFSLFNSVYGHAVGDAVLRQMAGRLKEVCRAGDAVARFGGDEFMLLLPDVGQIIPAAELERRLLAGLEGLSFQPAGETAIPITASVGADVFPQGRWDGGALDGAAALHRAEERLLRAKSGAEVESEAARVRARALRSLSGFSMLDALVTAVDNKDRYTRRHSEDVMEYSLLIARELGLGNGEEQTVAIAALLHDVGKIGVPDAILRKPGKLTDAEFEVVRQHPQMGAIIVQAVPGLEDTLDAVRHHHERWDGEGYPFSLRGGETPLMARLMAVADAYSAMTTDRPYRRGMEQAKAFSILEAGAGTQWDPTFVTAFLTAMSKFPDGVL